MNVDEGYPPDYEIAAWKNFDLAVCGFCIEQTRQTRDASPIISTLVGEDLEWFGAHGILFMVNKLIENELEKRELENKCVAYENTLETESSLNRNLRRQLTQLQRTAQDSEWRLQEQLASTSTQLQVEKSVAKQRQEEISRLETLLNQNDLSNIENESIFGDSSPITSISVTTTPVTSTPAWKDRRSIGSWSGSGSKSQTEKLMRVAERLNITPSAASNDMF